MAVSIVTAATATSSGTTITVTKPAAVANGDLLLAFHQNVWNAYANMGVGTSGFTFLTGYDGGTNQQHFKCYYKVAASEGASWVFASNDDDNAMTVVVLRGADNTPANWLYAAPVAHADGATRTCASVSGAAAGSVLLCSTGGPLAYVTTTTTPPSGMTEQSDFRTPDTGLIQSVASLLSPSNPTGTKDFVFANYTGSGFGGTEWSIVIPQAGGAATPNSGFFRLM